MSGTLNSTHLLSFDYDTNTWTVVSSVNAVVAPASCTPTVVPSAAPSVRPTKVGETNSPTISLSPTCAPTVNPTRTTAAPTLAPTNTHSPTRFVTLAPTVTPSSDGDTNSPTFAPTARPTQFGETNAPTAIPTPTPTRAGDTNSPSRSPTVSPTSVGDTNKPTVVPTVRPTTEGETNAPTRASGDGGHRPLLSSLSCAGSGDTIRISYDISGPGVFYCGAFRHDLLPRVLAPWSVSSEADGWAWASHESSSVHNTLDIGPVRRTVSYSVRCVSDVFPYADRFTNLSDSASFVSVCNTSAAPGLTIFSDDAIAVVGYILGPLVVSVDEYFFANNVTAVPTVYYRASPTDDYCGADVSMSSLVTDSSVVAPSQFIFDWSAAGRTRLLYVQPAAAGCIYVALSNITVDQHPVNVWNNVTGPVVVDIDDKGVIFKAIAFRVYPSVDSIVAAPVVSSSFFSIYGNELIVEYLSDTDMGKSAGLHNSEFDCSLLFDFVGSSESICRFSSPRRVVAVLYPVNGSDLVQVNDNITILGGIVRARCLSSGPSCQGYPFQAASTTAVLASKYPSDVFVSISGPSVVSLCSDIELDISRSVGNGGRKWSSISWRVYNLFNTRAAPALEAHLNSLDWEHCLSGSGACNVVDSRLFPVGVELTLMLRLTNFVGLTGFGTHRIVRTNDSFPISSIGRTRVVVTRDSPISLNIFRYNVDCAHLGQPAVTDPLTVSWYILDDRLYVIDIDGLNVSQLSRRLTIPSYAFSTGFGYVIDASVENSLNQSSATSSLLYLRAGRIGAIIVGGSRATVAADENFLLDAGGSYHQDYEIGGLVYSWSCIKIAPTLSESCDGFDLLAKNQSRINIDGSAMSPDSTYVFTVIVSDGITGSSLYSYESIEVHVSDLVTPDISAAISGVSVPIPSLYDVPISFDAVVTSSGPFTVTWYVVEPVNATVNSISFPAGGIVSFPLDLPYTSFVPGRDYTFQLHVLPTEGCDGTCAAFIYDIPFAVNSAPTSGYILGSPTTGTIVTAFTFSAVEWVDMDLPMAYTFFSSYAETSDDGSLISPRSERSWIVAHLMSGDANNTHLVFVHAVISDVYGYEASSPDLAITVFHDEASISTVQDTVAKLLVDEDYALTFMHTNILRNEIDPDFGEAGNNCSDVVEQVACLSIADTISITAERLTTGFQLDEDTSCDVIRSFTSVVDLYVDEVVFLTLEDLILSAGLATLFRIAENMNTVCHSGVCSQKCLEDLLVSINKLVGLYGRSFPEFVPSRRKMLTTEAAAAAAYINEANSLVVDIVSSVLEYFVVMGGTYNLVLSNYDIHVEKGWPLLLNLPSLQGNLLLDSELFDGDTASYGFQTVSVRLEEIPAANCTNPGLPCSITSSSMYSTVYVNTLGSDITQPTALSQGFLLPNLFDPLGLVTSNSQNSVRTTCDANEQVQLRCTRDDTYGYAFSENVTCPDLIPDNSNVSMLCPVYDVVPLCAENGDENSDCVASQVSSSSILCSCPLELGASVSAAIPAVSVEGYGTFSSTVRMNSIFGTTLTQPSEIEAPSSTEGGGQQTFSLNNVLSPNLLLFLIPLQILCCCCIILCCIFFAVRRRREEKTETDDETFDEVEFFDDEDSFFDDASDDDLFDEDGFFDDDEDAFMGGIEELDEEEDDAVASTPSIASAPEKVARGTILDLGQSEESLGTSQEAGERDRKLDRWFDVVFEDGSNDYDHDAVSGASSAPGDSFDTTYSSNSDGDEDGSGEYSY